MRPRSLSHSRSPAAVAQLSLRTWCAALHVAALFPLKPLPAPPRSARRAVLTHVQCYRPCSPARVHSETTTAVARMTVQPVLREALHEEHGFLAVFPLPALAPRLRRASQSSVLQRSSAAATPLESSL